MATLIDLSTYLNDLSGKIEPHQSDLQLAVTNQVARIKTRTAQGIGVDLQIFAPYAASTKKAAPVNLKATGQMLDAIVTEATDSSARIFFDDSVQAEKASYHNEGTRHLPQRKFFGISLQDRESIVGDIRSALFRRVNRG
jgi:hypothetical protein